MIVSQNIPILRGPNLTRKILRSIITCYNNISGKGSIKEVEDNIPQVGEHTKNTGYPLV